jgi:SulP family sulfate permease
MKFGKTLESLMVEKWRYSYIDYKRLKKLLKMTLNEDEFLVELYEEIGKVNALVQVEEGNLRTLSINLSTARRSNTHQVTYERSKAFYTALEELVAFCEVNYTIVYKITKKFDKQSGLCISPRVLNIVEKESFMTRLNGDVPKHESSNVDAQSDSLTYKQQSLEIPPVASAAIENFEALIERVSDYVKNCHRNMNLGEDVDLIFEIDNKKNLSLFFTDIKNELRKKIADLVAEGIRHKGAGATPVESFQEGLFAAITKARTSLFSGLAREMVRDIELVSPEGVVGLEHIMQLQSMCFANAHVDALEEGIVGNTDAGNDFLPPLSESSGTDKALDFPSPASSTASSFSLFPTLVVLFNNCRNAFTPHIATWLPSYRLRSYLPRDILAGVTIGVLLIPQGLAYAGLAGLPAFRGIHTAFPPAAYTLLGTSRHSAIGPQSIPALLISQGLGKSVGTGASYERAVAGVTFVVGVLLLLAGYLRLGFIVRFISKPVMAGFAGGSAVLTIINSLKDVLGVGIPKSSDIFSTLRDIIWVLPHTQWPCLLTAIVAFMMLLVLPKAAWSSTVPPPLQVTLLSIVIFATYMNVAGMSGQVETPRTGDGNNGPDISYRGPGNIPLVGNLERSLPRFILPWPIPVEHLPIIIQTAAAVSLVGFIESISVAQTYAQQYGYSCNPSTELKALGAVNMIGGTLGTLPVMAAFGRSGVNAAAGVATPLAQAISAVVVALIIAVASPALYFLPAPVLSAIVIKAVLGLIDIQLAKKLLVGDKMDAACLVAAFFATVILGVLYGVLISVAISLVLFVGTAVRTKVDTLGRVRGTATYAPLDLSNSSNVRRLVAPLRTCCALRFEGPLWFANAGILKDAMLEALSANTSNPPRLRWSVLVLDCSAITYLDSTAALTLEECVTAAHKENIPLVIASCPAGTLDTLRRFGLIETLGGDAFVFIDVHSAVSAVSSRKLSSLNLPRLEADDNNNSGSRISSTNWRQFILKFCFPGPGLGQRIAPDTRDFRPLNSSRTQTEI